MNWIPLNLVDQLDSIVEQSFNKPQIILKHSTTCSISRMALARLERSTSVATGDFYYLDLLQCRAISNLIAEKFAVHHESPQILVIKNGDCTYTESHYGITMEEIIEQTQG